MNVALILIVCLAGVCHDERLPNDVSWTACSVRGQVMAREWLDEHPKYTLRGWRCQIGSKGHDA